MKIQLVNFVDSLAPTTSQAMPDNPLIIWSRRKCKLLYWELLRSTTTGNRRTCKKNAELKIYSSLVRKFMSLRSFAAVALANSYPFTLMFFLLLDSSEVARDLAFSAIQGPVTGSSCQSILIVHRQPALLLTDTIFCAQNLYLGIKVDKVVPSSLHAGLTKQTSRLLTFKCKEHMVLGACLFHELEFDVGLNFQDRRWRNINSNKLIPGRVASNISTTYKWET